MWIITNHSKTNKMKKSVITFAILVFTISVSAQKLIDIYKSGTVKLVADNEYAQGNNWDKVFETYYDTIYETPMGERKSLIIMPDGSVTVNHRYRNYYTKFSPEGVFENEFGITNKEGKKYKKTNAISGIINDNTFFTELDNMGNMICFNFDGNYVKTLKLDYMTRQMIPLSSNKIAVVGWVLWKTKIREFVAIVDYETNKQNIIWDHFTDRCKDFDHCTLFNYAYKFEKGGAFSFTTMPFSKMTGMSSPPKIACIGEKLVIGIPATGEILVYDLTGNLESKKVIDWATNYISVDEQIEIQQKAIDQYENKDIPVFASQKVTPAEIKLAQETILKQMKEDLGKISEPISLPTFSTLIKDSDGNILFFDFPEENDANKINVWVYENGGSFVCQSSFVCDEYELQINPHKMVFHNGYIYGLQHKKDVDGVPLRLVRFRLANN